MPGETTEKRAPVGAYATPGSSMLLLRTRAVYSQKLGCKVGPVRAAARRAGLPSFPTYEVDCEEYIDTEAEIAGECRGQS
jgi:hypothetical protein